MTILLLIVCQDYTNINSKPTVPIGPSFSDIYRILRDCFSTAGILFVKQFPNVVRLLRTRTNEHQQNTNNHQPTNQQIINQPINQSIHHSINQPINRTDSSDTAVAITYTYRPNTDKKTIIIFSEAPLYYC